MNISSPLSFGSALPEEVGVPSGRILAFLNRLERRQIPMHSVLILRRDKLIAEGYYSPIQKDEPHRMFSISKSLTAVAILLLADEGRLSLDDPIVNYFPDKVPADVHPWIAKMTIREMLMMRTCHASTTYKINGKADWVESFFTVPPTHPSGRFFHYDTSSAHVLADLVSRLSGRQLLDYLKEKLPELGLSEGSYMLEDPFGVPMGGSGLVATPMDVLKFGYFLLRRGELCGKRLLSESLLDAALTRQTSTLPTGPLPSESCGYGYMIWIGEQDAPVLYGMGGQLVILLPKQEMIVVTTADTQGIGGGNQVLYDALYEELLPYVSQEPLPVSDADAAHYREAIAGLRMQPLAEACGASLSSKTAKRISGQIYHLAENPMGFSDMSVTIGESPADTGVLSFTLRGESYSFPFGMGHLADGTFPVYDFRCAASGVWLDADTLYVKAHILDAYVGSVRFTLHFAGDTLSVFLKKIEETYFSEFNGHLYGEALPLQSASSQT